MHRFKLFGQSKSINASSKENKKYKKKRVRANSSCLILSAKLNQFMPFLMKSLARSAAVEHDPDFVCISARFHLLD